MLSFNVLIIVLVVLSISFGKVSSTNAILVNSTKITNDPQHLQKPTTKPLLSPSNKPVYKYPTKKPLNRKSPTVRPVYKYPTKMPIHLKPHTVKPVYKYPTKKPLTLKPPTVIHSSTSSTSCLLL